MFETYVNRKDLIDSTNEHIKWIENIINEINSKCGGSITNETMQNVAALAQAKSTALLTLSNLVR
ncbi:hypothetical protein B2I21_08825 [Chryseobacterium mucoviscidosis]|nr:hypothetical protein B2I21_08825 [Chryseobacterium mucoviscidosis]